MATTKVYAFEGRGRGLEWRGCWPPSHRGAASVEGVDATRWRVPETLSDAILQKMKAPPKANDVEDIRQEQLVEADGFIFGFPSRFSMMPRISRPSLMPPMTSGLPNHSSGVLAFMGEARNFQH